MGKDIQKKNLTNLSKYANEMGVYKNLMNIMEVLLNRQEEIYD